MAGGLVLPANKCFLDIIGYSLKRSEGGIKGRLALGKGAQICRIPEKFGFRDGTFQDLVVINAVDPLNDGPP